jgi:hypothetical protein
MALNCFREKSTQRGITMTEEYVDYLFSPEGHAIAAGRSVFSMKMVKQDDNFNEADDYEEKQQILAEIAEVNADAITESDPSEYSSVEL